MTAGQRVIAQPAFQGRAAGLVLAATFAVGVITGLVVPALPLLRPAAPAAVDGSAAALAEAAYRSYREGERNLPVIASEVGDVAWRTYRQDERATLATTPVTPTDPWQLYRQGERESLATAVPVSFLDAWRLYRAGERGDRTP